MKETTQAMESHGSALSSEIETHGLYTMILARSERICGAGYLLVKQRYTKSVAPCVNVRETPRFYVQ